MRRRKNRKGSVMVAVLCIFVLVAAFSVIIFQYSTNNLQQAKMQEESIRAYYLAYSGCEIAYAGLVQACGTDNWKDFLNNKLSLLPPKIEIKKSQLDYLDDSDIITISLNKETDAGEFKNWLKITSVGQSNLGSKFPGERVKYLYVNPEDYTKTFWK